MRVADLYPWVAERWPGYRCGASAYATAECPLKCHRSARVRFWLGADNRLMFGCYACGESSKLEMLRALGCGWKDCFPDGRVPDRVKQEVVARYVYTDEDRRCLYQTVRLEPGHRGRDKDFRQRRPDPSGRGWVWNLDGVRRVLYRLPELLAAKPTEPAFVVAGEKDVESLRSIGLLATTNVCGERAEWLDSYSEALAGRDVIVVEDRDSAGRRHACEVRGSLMDYAKSIRRVVFPEKDATAFLMSLRRLDVTTPADLRAYVWGAVEEAPRWSAVADRGGA